MIAGISLWASAQCGTGPILTVNNPSFEGTPAPHVTPPGWDICMPGVTPDTQPGSWGVALPPSNGSSYIGLVYAPSIPWQEGAGQNLSSPMVAGTSYNFTIDLATMASADPLTGIVLPPYCDQLQLWGGMAGVNSGCDQSELLWTSPVITNTTWQTYNLSFTPSQNWNHILFVIWAQPPACTDGQYLLMDNMSSIVPVADIAEFNWTDVCFGNAVNFTDSSTAGQGTIVSWNWDFGDGSTGTGQNPSHNYTAPGTYNVSLTTYSSVPCTANVVHTINVWPVPSVTVSGGGSICAGTGNTVDIVFTFTGTPPWNLTYTDGVTPTTVNGINSSPYTISVSNTGTWTATSVSNGQCPGTTSGSATVSNNSNPNVSFGVLSNVCLNQAAFLLTTGSPSGGTYSGPGVSNNMFDANTAGVGTHTLTYTYTDPVTGCIGTAQQTITVGTDMSASITPQSATICQGDSVTLVCSPADIIHWSPSAGLSDTSTSMVIATPSVSTTYTVYVENTGGCTGSASVTVMVYENAAINFTALPPNGCEPLHVQFGFTPGPDILDSSWVWFFNDPYSDTTFSTDFAPSHFFSTQGSYPVVLNVMNQYGCIGRDTLMINVYPNPIADFIMHPDVVDMDNPAVSFVDQSTNAANWLWDFGDPASGNQNWAGQPSAVHIFSDSGTYYITLVVESEHGCVDTVVKPLTVYPQLLIFIPNAFTPDGNGLNDIFMPIITGFDQNTFDMAIFDRWGKELFKTEDLYQGWDGRAGGEKACPAGVYSYIIHITDLRGKEHKIIGHVSIIR